MDIQEISKALSSETRLKLISIVGQGERSAIDIYKQYLKKFSDTKHRESIYRELEKLVKWDIMEKYYNVEKKELLYRLKFKKLLIDLIEGKISSNEEPV